MARPSKETEMTDTEKPEALRLAEWIESDMTCDGDITIAVELRRQHAEIEALREALKGALEPLEIYHAHGWSDRAGVRAKARAALERK
jgi:hypothetical protein